MAYKVEISLLARQDIFETTEYIREQSGIPRATRWKNGLISTIKELREMPLRYAVAEESADLRIELRELNYHSHRVIYLVLEDSKTVRVLRVYHSARIPLNLDKLA